MRALFLPLLLSSGLAMASCEAQLTAQHTALSAEASRLYLLPAVPLHINELSPGILGQYFMTSRSIELSPKTCNYSDEILEGTVAHELGHAITHQLYPDLPPGPRHEQLADYYGAHILGRPRSEVLLETLHGYCSQGFAQSCFRQTNWAYALTH